MLRLHVGLLSAAMILVALASAHGQNRDSAPSPYFDCPYVNYFDGDCPQLRKLWQKQERRLEQQDNPAGVRDGQDGDRRSEQSGQENDGTDSFDTGERYLLFPKESLAPDAPPLFRLLLAEPTIENARLYVRWYARRTDRLRAVQALIQRAGREFETGTRVPEEER